MLPIQFAIELENSINDQIKLLSSTYSPMFESVLSLTIGFQKEFLHVLTKAEMVNLDTDQYPDVDIAKLLGPDIAWQEFIGQNTYTIIVTPQSLTALWMTYALIDRSIQYYQQAAANSAHPVTRLFFHSLSEVKKILRRRLAGVIQTLNNHYWGELGFAPFIFGKD